MVKAGIIDIAKVSSNTLGQFDDRYAKENYRRMRKLWGTNSIFSADLLFEYKKLCTNLSFRRNLYLLICLSLNLLTK